MRRLASIALAVCVAGSAEAQQREILVQRFSEESHRDDDTARLTIAKFSTCVAKKKRADASEYVREVNPDRKRENQLLAKVGDQGCLRAALSGSAVQAELQFPGDTLRYCLADALIQLELANGPVLSFANVPALPPRAFDASKFEPKPGKTPSKRELENLANHRSRSEVATFMAGFGECVVRSDSVKSYELLMTQVTSKEEAAQMGKLTPVLASCIPQQRTVSLNKTVVRGSIAMNYYRLAKAVPVAVSGAAR